MPLSDELVRYFCRHLVPIYFHCQNKKYTQKFIVTAFVLSVGESWFLVTAGHCISAIEKLIGELNCEIKKCLLLDSK